MFENLGYLSGARVAQGSWLGESYTRERNKVLLVKDRQQKRFLPQLAACCARERGLQVLTISASAHGDFFNILTFSFLGGGQQGVCGPGRDVWGRMEREPSLGIIRKVSMDFYFMFGS